jgi:hypothetical protein
MITMLLTLALLVISFDRSQALPIAPEDFINKNWDGLAKMHDTGALVSV